MIVNKISVNKILFDSGNLFSLAIEMTLTSQFTLLTEIDPDPVELVNASSQVPLLLLCEHAGHAIPKSLKNLGLDKSTLSSHRAWDIGAETLARKLAQRINAPLILQRYSRLVIDPNRPPGSSESIPEISDRIEISANKNLDFNEREARRQAIFEPMDQAIQAAFDFTERKAAFSIHSYTPVFDGHEREWNAGFLSRKSLSTAESLINSVAQMKPDLNLAINQPYQIDDETDWFIPQHAEKRLLPHCLIEIRNDQINHETGVSQWVKLLAKAINDLMKGLL